MVFKLVLRVVVLLMLLSMPCVVLAQQRNDVEEAIADAKENAELDVSMLDSMFLCSHGGAAVSLVAVSPSFTRISLHRRFQHISSSANQRCMSRPIRQYARRGRIQATAIGCGVAAGVSAVTTLFYRLPQFYDAL